MEQKQKKKTIECVRQIINYSVIDRESRFDKATFDSSAVIDSLPYTSPKILSLLRNIQQLDAKDHKTDGKLYKHFIYSGVGNGYGSKIIASCMIAAGYTLIQKPVGNKIVVDPKITSSKNESKLALLSSTSLWNKPMRLTAVKEILEIFNKRPSNVHGNNVRFIILDSGFKEGIDLLDIKYVHLFEESIYSSDYTQSVGRALRYCGQKGLPFKSGVGWTVNVFSYSLVKTVQGKGAGGLYEKYINGKKDINVFNTNNSLFDLLMTTEKSVQFKINFGNELTNLIQESSVDYNLNKNINLIKSDRKVVLIASVVAAVLTGAAVNLIFRKNK